MPLMTLLTKKTKHKIEIFFHCKPEGSLSILRVWTVL